ncbi:MAG: hypothetical protein IE928_04915 [Gammaproteobacteria bacterium]|nr:hypothetical protein [Gammaproteobacteria bacterium]
MTAEEEKKILESAPVGTWALLAAYGVMFTLGWLVMWYLFISNGPVK